MFNPYQLQGSGVHFWDNPYDLKHPLSIYDPQLSPCILLEMVGTFCSFATRVPTPKELDSLPHVTLTANTPWDPSQAFFHMHEMEEEKRWIRRR